MMARFRTWLQARRAKQESRAFDNGWDWAAGELLRGKNEEDVQIEIDAGSTFDDVPVAFDLGARAAVNTYIARVYLEAQYKPFNPIC